jgi:predicted HTH transcriptional regulator
MKTIYDLKNTIEGLVLLENETETVEFKVNNYRPEEIGKRISSLSNTACLKGTKFAYLVFGIKDKTHEIVGTKKKFSNEKKGAMSLEHWLRRMLDPKIDFEVFEFEYNGKHLVVLEIPPVINHPVKFQNISYVRIGSETTELKKYPEKESKIWNNLNNRNFEKNLSVEGLSVAQVLEVLDYSAFFTHTKESLPTVTHEFVEKMAQYGLVNPVLNNLYDITNLGALLFGKDLGKFSSVKRKTVRVIQYEGNTRVNRLKEQEYKVGYAVIFEELIKYINDRLPSNEIINAALRTEKKMYPEVAIREFVANALIHQDLSISGSGVMIEIFDDRIEITNPGSPLIDINRFIDHPPRSRNESIASLMRLVGICEEGGTGVDRALVNLGLYQLPAPKFETYDNSTKITLFAYKDLKDMSLEDKVRACYQHAVLQYVQNLRMTNESLRERLGINKSNYPAASVIIRAAIVRKAIKDSERVKEYIPIWA